MGTHPIFESDFDCLTENFIIDMTSVLNTTTESVQSYNQTYEELPLNVLPPFNVWDIVDEDYDTGEGGTVNADSDYVYFIALSIVGLLVNVTYLTKLTRASNDESVIKCSLTQYVLVAIVALNIIHAVVVLPIMADMYYTGSFFSNSMWGICICRLYLFARTATSSMSTMLISLLCLSRFVFFVNKLRMEHHTADTSNTLGAVRTACGIPVKVLLVLIALTLGFVCAAPDLFLGMVFDEQDRFVCKTNLERRKTTTTPLDLANVFSLNKSTAPNYAQRQSGQTIELTLKEHRLFMIAIEYFIPLTIILSCYIAIGLRYLVRPRKMNRLVNFLTQSGVTLMLSMSFVVTFSPLNLYLAWDWKEYVYNKNEEIRNTPFMFIIIKQLHFCLMPLLYCNSSSRSFTCLPTGATSPVQGAATADEEQSLTHKTKMYSNSITT